MLTNPGAIPPSKRDVVDAVCRLHGPTLVGSDPDDDPAVVFEAITRKFWRDLITQHEADQAAAEARGRVLANNRHDFFEEATDGTGT